MSKLVVFGSTSRVGINYIKYHHMTEKSTVIGFSRKKAAKDEKYLEKSAEANRLYEDRYVDLTDINSIEKTAAQLISEEISSILLIAGAYPLRTKDINKEIENSMELVMTHSIFYTKLIDMIFNAKEIFPVCTFLQRPSSGKGATLVIRQQKRMRSKAFCP